MRDAVLAIDQGTTNTKALLVAADGSVIASASAPTATHHPRPGWAEQSAQAIWDSAAQVIAALATTPDVRISAIAISNQRESALLWDAQTGAPVGPCVIWQCRRSAPQCAALRADGQAEAIRAMTGLALDPLFSAGKWRWLLDNVPEAGRLLDQDRLRAGTVDTWLLWKLTGGASHATDTSNAARTQLLDLATGQWDAGLADCFGIPLAILPQVRPSDSCFGTTAAGAVSGLPPGIAIHAMMGDSHAALHGHGFAAPGHVKVTLGTGSSLMCAADRRVRSRHGLSETVAWQRGDIITHALEGNIAVSGQTAAYIGSLLGVGDAEGLTRLAASVPDSGGVTVLPALSGLGAPHWDDAARGLIAGLSHATGPAHIARAALEGIAHQICDVVEAIEADLGAPIAMLHADGGATRNALLIQLLADLADRPVQIAAIAELSAMGAARMAASAAGLGAFKDSAANAPVHPSKPAPRRMALRAEWSAAIAQSRLRARSLDFERKAGIE
ncbi:glycerol kinase [Novosphingobium flavum]|uniref:ATP:glycerol 3-phosphotransferase n=1 Tax=Novosphingobium aerophilum TaxID=2839843 RepID=A0A7X1F9L9_9SPHN|nr:FGGY family carbohydrate kinase [Novosphingobium aerophilum]MBC2652937.1 glycerol kinase [Novosphingobium aerophilum]MBC2662017.1 glycerol kinase [Novosphingobium aerophilum]